MNQNINCSDFELGYAQIDQFNNRNLYIEYKFKPYFYLMKNLFPSHDEFIRSILSDKNLAIDYIKNALPESIVGKLDFSTLEQLPETYISEELQKLLSDIVYQVGLKDSKKKIKVSILVEHKSFPYKYVTVQMGSYIFSSFQKQILNKEPLSVVIPILLYHGEKRWKYRTLASLFEGIDDELKPFIPDFEFIFNDLGRLQDNEIEALENRFLAASFLALKHNWNRKWLEENILRLLTFAMQGPEGLQKGLIIYIGSRSVFTENVLNSLPVSIKKDVMNSLEIYYEKGMQEGMEKGIEKGRLKGIEEGIEKGMESIVLNLINSNQFTVSQIASLAGVSESFVRKVRGTSGKKKS